MNNPAPTFVIQLTPPGRAALAGLLVAGPAADDLVEPLLCCASGRPLSSLKPSRIALGHWRGSQPEEVVVVRRPPRRIEIHCHGGAVAIEALIGDLVAAGARSLSWQEWLARDADDPLSAEARIALAEARTERTAAILLDQYHGALGNELRGTLALLRGGDLAAAAGRIDRLLACGELGRHLTAPWSVVLAGPPNVGKSSLINALVGYRRAIVLSEPGTTRDVVVAATAVEGWPIELSDTAGIRETDHALEAAGIEAARQRTATADLRLLVFDRGGPYGKQERRLAATWPDAVVVHNKSDLPPDKDSRPGGILTSALAGIGIDTLIHAIAERLVPAPPEPGAAVPFRERHVAHLQAAREALAGGNAAAADTALESLQCCAWRRSGLDGLTHQAEKAGGPCIS